jgi:hypothetical protein
MAAKRITGVLAIAAGALALADPASAASKTYCVEKPECAGIDRATFQAALNSAKAHGGRDRIELGPATFLSHTGFNYSASAPNTVEIVGMGADATRLRTDPVASDAATLVLHGGSVSDLEILGPYSIGEDVDNKTLGLELLGDGARLRIVGGFTNVRLRQGATLTDSTLSEGGIPGYQRPSIMADDGEATVTDSTVESRGVANLTSDTGRLTISRSRITAPWGVIAGEGGTVHVDNTLFRGVGHELYALTAYSQAASAELVATNVTVAGDAGTTAGHGVAAVSDGGGTVAAASVRNSVLTGVPLSIRRESTQGSARITLAHSAFDPSRLEQSGGGTLNTSEANHDAPNLVDFHLPPGSPLIDAGSADGVSGTDLDGAARVVDGDGDGVAAPDIGAFEFVPGPSSEPPGGDPGVIPAAAPVLSKLTLTRRKFRVAGKRLGTTVRFRLDTAATVRLRVFRVKGGRRVGSLVRAGRAGSNKLRFRGRFGRRTLRPGRYVVRARAMNSAGRRSATRSVKFRIIR